MRICHTAGEMPLKYCFFGIDINLTLANPFGFVFLLFADVNGLFNLIAAGNIKANINITKASRLSAAFTSRSLLKPEWVGNGFVKAARLFGTNTPVIAVESRLQPYRACGSVKKNVAPLPGSLFTQTLPPWLCTMCLTMDKPRPVPPCSRDRALSTR